jgi:hypothetical protein
LQVSISTPCSIKIIDDNVGRGITSISVDATKKGGKKFDQSNAPNLPPIIAL